MYLSGFRKPVPQTLSHNPLLLSTHEGAVMGQRRQEPKHSDYPHLMEGPTLTQLCAALALICYHSL